MCIFLILTLSEKKSLLLEKMGVRSKGFRRRASISNFREKSASHPNCYQLVKEENTTPLARLGKILTTIFNKIF